MITQATSTDFAARIRQLQDEREQHADAVARIDAVLAGVGVALGGPPAKRRPGRPPSAATALARAAAGPAVAATAGAKPGKPGPKPRGRGRRRYATTADDSILTFVRERKNPTTKEIKQHWESEHRGGSADNVLSKLIKDKKLTREPLGVGIRGSRYSIA